MSDRQIHSVRTGPRGGAPVVLVHPVSLDLGYWSEQVSALAQDHDVVTYDLPGHGRSPGTPADWSFDQAAAVLARLVRDLNAGPAHIVGLSVGGMIAQALALAEPALVVSLSLIGTAADFPEAGRAAIRARAQATRDGGMAAVLQSSIARWFSPETVTQRPDLIDRVTRTFLVNDPAIHAAMWDMIAELDFAGEIHRIACPTLVLVGELDPSTPPATARFLAETIPGAELHIIPGASHMVPFEQPAAVNDHLLRLLAGRKRL